MDHYLTHLWLGSDPYSILRQQVMSRVLVRSAKVFCNFARIFGHVNEAHFSPDGSLVALCKDQSITMWNVNDRKTVGVVDYGPIDWLSFSSDSKMFATGSRADNQIYLFRIGNKLDHHMTAHNAGRFVVFTSDSDKFITRKYAALYINDTQDGSVVRLGCDIGFLPSIALTCDNTDVILYHRRWLYKVCLLTRSVTRFIKLGADEIDNVTLSHNKSKVLVFTRNYFKKIHRVNEQWRIYDISTGGLLFQKKRDDTYPVWVPSEDSILQVTRIKNPDKSMSLVPYCMNVLDLLTGETQIIAGPSSYSWKYLEFSRDGSRFLITYVDGSVIIWELEN